MKLAKSLDRLGTETAFSVLAEAKKLEAAGKPMIHLGLGQPDFKTPKHIVDAAKKALDDGHHGYVLSNGILECRQSVTRKIKKLSPAKLLQKLNLVAGKNGIGRVDLVENRFIGIKSRGVYETPGGTLLVVAHRAMESVTLDKKTMHKKDEIMPKYAELIYNGFWFSKARFKLQKIVDLKRISISS